jgi:hypothetical protein
VGPELNTQISRAPVAKTRPQRMRSADLILEDGDVVVTLEVAGIWRSGPGLTAPTTQTLSEYRVAVQGQAADAGGYTFEMYDPAIANGDSLAADRGVRLFYAEGDALTLLKDYRPAPRL